jgi:hypothetical protein
VTETETDGHEASKVTYGRVKATGLGRRVRLGVGFCATWEKQGQRGGVLGVVRRWAAWWQGREAPSNVARLDMARSRRGVAGGGAKFSRCGRGMTWGHMGAWGWGGEGTWVAGMSEQRPIAGGDMVVICRQRVPTQRARLGACSVLSYTWPAQRVVVSVCLSLDVCVCVRVFTHLAMSSSSSSPDEGCPRQPPTPPPEVQRPSCMLCWQRIRVAGARASCALCRRQWGSGRGSNQRLQAGPPGGQRIDVFWLGSSLGSRPRPGPCADGRSKLR